VLTIEDLAWLARFAGQGPFTRPADQHARLITHQLGDHHVVLLQALRSAGIDC
jgi:hypothetical protein